MSDYVELGRLCADTAREAGERVLAWRRERGQLSADVVDTKSSPTDVVTEADRMAEQLIRERLMSARPDAAWLGEETGRSAGSGGEGLEWVVDPIDGTTNFLYDLPGWSVSIACRAAEESVAAAVHVPTFGETFTAVRGEGAFVEDAGGRRSLTASTATDLETALIATGFAYDVQDRTGQGALVGTLVGRVRDIRRFGAASVDLCSVAAGRVDGYFERGLEPWDLAAGLLIASEAGAVVRQHERGTTTAAGAGIADKLDRLLDELGD
ncbi:MAG TPA: inositol monophosphatase family protein [Actinomycetes bacterium]|nr:inositol monophosphatase family protein [Actinomycetes bacterium]